MAWLTLMPWAEERDKLGSGTTRGYQRQSISEHLTDVGHSRRWDVPPATTTSDNFDAAQHANVLTQTSLA